MSNVTKKDLVHSIAQSMNSVDEESVGVIVQKFIDLIMENLADGRTIEFRRFGVFKPAARKAKKGRNIKKGISVDIPASLVVKFEPGSEFSALMDRLKGNKPEFFQELLNKTTKKKK